MNALSPVPFSAVPLVPGTLYAVGAGIPADMPVSWIPEGLGGWMPVQCFVLRDGADAIVLDSGLGVHRPAIGAGLREALKDAGRPRALISRWEPDSMVNLPWLIEQFGIREVLSYGGIDPLDFFERFENEAAASQVRAASGPARLVPIEPGEIIPLGALRIEVVPVSLRLLLTVWFYEHTTGTLFTADSLGFLPNRAAPIPFATRPAPDLLTSAALHRSLKTKFDWLAGAYCDTLIADLDALQARFPIQRVCPSFGGIIEGRTCVDGLFRATVDALRQLAFEPPVSALFGFDFARALSPSAAVDVVDPSRVPTACGTR